MHSIRFLIQSSTEYLTKHHIAAPRLSAEELLAFVLRKKRLDLFMDYDAPVTSQEVDTYRTLIQRKKKGEPLGYLLGQQPFLECQLTLSPAVLIPRQETEVFVHLALKEIPNESKVLWDLCTGSGCMGLAAKKERPNLEVTLSDISEEALALAQKNSEQNELTVAFLKGDLLAPFEGKKADFVFCNPPYVSEEEYLTLEKEVHFEPKEALIAKGRGLEFYIRLSQDLPAYLNKGAKVFLEIGDGQGGEVMEIFNQSYWKQRRYEKDWAKKDRFFFLEFHPDIE